MMENISFKDKNEFYQWMLNNHQSNDGIHIRYDKLKKESSLTYEESLDIALCFGWIDGVLKKIDDQFYTRYFTKRLPKSIWSTKNKKSVERLMKDGLMMPKGIEAVEIAKKDGRWEKADLPPEDFDTVAFKNLLLDYPEAYESYIDFSNSIQKTYAMSYYVLKKEESRAKRLLVIISRLEKHLKPMD